MAFGEEGGDATAPLISSDHAKRHLNVVRNGNEWTASAHVITAVIGSGVLSLAWSVAQLGWVAGPGTMVVFASVTALQSTIFADCYRSPDPEHGPHRNRTYAHAVERNLGLYKHEDKEAIKAGAEQLLRLMSAMPKGDEGAGSSGNQMLMITES